VHANASGNLVGFVFAIERELSTVLPGGYLTEVREYLSILRGCCQFLRTTAAGAGG
jgi:hypothetical protein